MQPVWPLKYETADWYNPVYSCLSTQLMIQSVTNEVLLTGVQPLNRVWAVLACARMRWNNSDTSRSREETSHPVFYTISASLIVRSFFRVSKSFHSIVLVSTFQK